MKSKCPDESLHMRRMNLNLCILHMLEEAFLLAAHMRSIEKAAIDTVTILTLPIQDIKGKEGHT